MIFRTQMITADANDSALVSASLTGNRDAFGAIVSRYQSLICSLAYSATGSLSQSEDLAQETFLIAWREMKKLKEPEKLRPWLCGIARNVISNTVRRNKREPAQHGETIEALEDFSANDTAPADHVIQREEEAILWRSLERIPETYREPLVLFYREGQSVERVAQELELTEDAVRQRLSRGRKLLTDEVTAFVESTLKISTPGRSFTVGVLAALPALTISANAATIGATAAKGSSAAKAAGVLGFLGMIMSFPLMFMGNYFGYRMNLDSATSEQERQYIRSFYRRLGLLILFFFVAYAVLTLWAPMFVRNSGERLAVHLFIGLTIAYSIGIMGLGWWSLARRRKLIAQLSPEERNAKPRPSWEYKSNFTLLGLPFVHLRIGGGIRAQNKPVKAWIAAGDTAIGVLFAYGGLAVAPVSLGGCAIGLIPWGGCAVGVLALGGFSVGVWSFGGVAVGLQAYGGLALAWHAAVGGVAYAHDFALGAFASAAEVNSKTASDIISAYPFFRYGNFVLRYCLAWMNLIWVVPMYFWWRVVRRTRQSHAGVTI